MGEQRIMGAQRSLDGSRSLRLCTVLVLLGLCVSACSGGADEGGQSSKRKSKSELDAVVQADCPSEPSADAAEASPTSLAPACQAAVFLQGVGREKRPELAELSDQQLTTYASGLCGYASVLASDPGRAQPTYDNLLQTTAASWGVDPAVVDAVAASLDSFCPASAPVLKSLPRSDQAIELRLSLSGSGAALVTFELPEGANAQERLTAPGEKVINLTRPERVSVQVQPEPGAEVGCNLSLGSNVLVEQAPSASQTTCAVADSQIEHALVGK